MEAARIKKILYIITKSNWGGAQRYVYDLATNLPTDSFIASVALGGRGALQQKLADAQVPTIELTNVQRDISVSADMSGFASLYRTIRKEMPDVVHLNSSKAAGLGALAARVLGVPKIVFTVHGWPFTEQRGRLWRSFAFVGSWVTAILAHDVIVISEVDLRIGKKIPFCRKKLRLIHNGIDFSMPFGTGEHIRNAFPPGTHITGTVGELTQNKNHIALVEQASKDSSMHVAIVGEGEEREMLEKKIEDYDLSDRVKLFGFMPASEVMKGFDTFAFPSLKEGLPYVLLEAKAAGLPIVANRVGGVPDVLDAENMNEFSLDEMLRKTIDVY